MDSDQGKLFIGGISWETDEGKLKDYFQGYGEVLRTVVMRDKISGNPRGFGFVVFADPNILDRVLQDRHVIDGRTVEAKRALSRDEQQVSAVGNHGGSRNSGGGGGNNTRTKKIFVGGLPPNLSEDGFRSYFEDYGVVTDVVIMHDQQTNRPRGFGFVSFDSEDAVERVLQNTFHNLNDKQVEVKRATPKDGGGGGRSMGGSGGYQGYGSSIGNSNSFDGRLDSNKYMQSQNGAGYPSYGSSGYNMPGFGYGPTTNNGMGYGYGNYGVPAGGGGYGNVNAPNAAGYGGGGPQNAQRNPWGSQLASGYGYGSSQWGSVGGTGGGPGSGGTGGGPGSGGAGQYPGGATGYGSQGYGYGGNDANQGSYGGVSGRTGSDGGGYGNSGSVWQSDPSQASASYGGGYGGASN